MFFQAESQLRQASWLPPWASGKFVSPLYKAIAVFKCPSFVQGSHFQCIPSQNLRFHYDFPDGTEEKNLPAMQETRV